MPPKKAERLFRLIGVLRTNRGYTGAELARLLGVSSRTVYRDIVDLSGIVSIYYDEGYRLLTDGPPAAAPFSREELLALKMAVKTPPLSDTSPYASAVRVAVEKIEEQLLGRFNEPREADLVALRVTAYPLEGQVVEVLRRLEDAVRASRSVSVSYFSQSRGEVTTRTLDPYGIAFRRHTWYLVAYCHWRKEERLFRVDRILEVKPSAHAFVRPPTFLLEAYFEGLWELYITGVMTAMTLRFTGRVAPIAAPALSKWGSFRPEEKEGAVVFAGTIPYSGEFKRWLLAFGPDVEVLEPADVRRALSDELARAASHYHGDSDVFGKA